MRLVQQILNALKPEENGAVIFQILNEKCFHFHSNLLKFVGNHLEVTQHLLMQQLCAEQQLWQNLWPKQYVVCIFVQDEIFIRARWPTDAAKTFPVSNSAKSLNRSSTREFAICHLAAISSFL